MMTQYGLQWLIESLRRYSPTMVREFYASYIATIKLSLPKGKKPHSAQANKDTNEGSAG